MESCKVKVVTTANIAYYGYVVKKDTVGITLLADYPDQPNKFFPWHNVVYVEGALP